MELDLSMELNGPLFDGRAEVALADYVEAVKKKLGQEGVQLVHHHLDVVLRNPTGNYYEHIKDRAFRNGRQIWDSKVIYGPWLEGTGSRNDQTRFKGYATFRHATGQLVATSSYLAQSIIDPYLERMGGRRT